MHPKFLRARREFLAAFRQRALARGRGEPFATEADFNNFAEAWVKYVGQKRNKTLGSKITNPASIIAMGLNTALAIRSDLRSGLPTSSGSCPS